MLIMVMVYWAVNSYEQHETYGFDLKVIASAWPHHRFPCALPDDLVDVMTQEEQWMAGLDKRAPRSREEVAKLIDASVLKEALAQR